MTIWTKQEEAEALKRRFIDVENRADFAREFKVPGGDSMINQHITGHRSISLKAAIAYANGFGCSLEEISPRHANAAKQASILLPSDNIVSQKRPLTKREQRINEIVALLQKTDIEGLAVVKREAERMIEQYPLAKQTLK